MRIPCPHCGPRIHEEFSCFGDATVRRPAAPAPGEGSDEPAVLAAFCDYVYQRDNPAGRHRELWFHGMGCHAWLVVERDTLTHAISGVLPARADGAVPR